MLTPYYSRDGVTIYCGNCLEVMPQLEPPVDAIIADWPYGTTACEWDSIIPLEPLWKECKRLIKGNGAVVLTASDPFTPILQMSNFEWYRYKWIWEKERLTNVLQVEKRPGKTIEDCLIFYQYQPIYNPQFSKHSGELRTNKIKNGSLGILIDAQNKKAVAYRDDRKRYPTQVLRINRDILVSNLHPTQKPVALMSYLIRTYTNPGELILDNTMGSGTTLVAAKNTGRRTIGIDIDEHWCKVAVDRLTNTKYISLPNGNGKLKAQQLELIS